MKVFSFVLILCFGLQACKPYFVNVDKNFVLITETYENDTLFLQDFLICGTFFNLRHLFLYRNHTIYYDLDDVLGLLVQHLDSHNNLVFEKGENRYSYYLCSNMMGHRNNKRTIEELKFLFPQKDNKVRVVPHFDFIKEFSIGKTMSPIGFYDESINLRQLVFLNIFFIRNADIYYMNNVMLSSKSYQDLEIDDESFPFFDLEKKHECIINE
jgi:uncharacterized protein YggL (DUF469 family)